MRFRVKRPKSVKRAYRTVAPDLDKYIRGVNDGLTGVAFEDDSQVIKIVATKEYSDTRAWILKSLRNLTAFRTFV
jgi:Holliday junction resolvase RusA-like endonuclease